MSRSYRKNPYMQDGNYRRCWIKNDANRRIRRTKNVPGGGAYKKFYPQWSICDHVWGGPLRDYIEDEWRTWAQYGWWYFNHRMVKDREPDEAALKIAWAKEYYWK